MEIVKNGIVRNYNAKDTNGNTGLKDLSGNNEGKINGGATVKSDHISLDGTNDWINLGQVQMTNKVTLEARIKLAYLYKEID